MLTDMYHRCGDRDISSQRGLWINNKYGMADDDDGVLGGVVTVFKTVFFSLSVLNALILSLQVLPINIPTFNLYARAYSYAM